MIIPYVASNFGPAWGKRLSNSPHSAKGHIFATPADLAWAAFTAGKPTQSSLGAHGYSSYLDGLAQACSVLSITEWDYPYIVKSSLQLAQEKTELAYSSNKTGNAFAKLVAAQLFGVKWLIHVSQLSKYKNISFWKKRAPDFAGLTRKGQWVVVEAKGTSGSFDQWTIQDGKEQTRSIRKIDGQFPILRAVTLSHYWSDTLCGSIEDPEEFDEDAIDLEFNLGDVLRIYYSSLTPPHTAGAEFLLLDRPYLIYENAIPGFDLGIPQYLPLESEPVTSENSWKIESQGFTIFPDAVAIRQRALDG